jgi:hypothetical protein
VHHVNRTEEAATIATLLGADEKHLIGVLFSSGPYKLILFERQREWLLAKDVLACLKGFDRNLHMPVIGGDHANNVDVITIEHMPVVTVGVSLTLADSVVVLGTVGVAAINVTDGNDIAEVRMPLSVAGSHASHADTADHWAVSRCLVGKRPVGPRKRYWQAGGDPGGKRAAEKLSSSHSVL